MLTSPTSSVALAATLMLLPVHAPLAGDVMVAVGGGVSAPPWLTVTVTAADVVMLPAVSVATACTS